MGRKPKLHWLVECDFCDQYHPEGWRGDCRDRKSRFETLEEYAERKGVKLEQVRIRQ